MQYPSDKSSGGYTLLETVTTVVVIGVLSAIATPTWLAFLTRLRLNAAQAEALTIMREAQVNAKREKRIWEACFYQNESEKKVQWSVSPFKEGGDICQNAIWQNLIGSDADKIVIDMDMASASHSTLYNKNNIYRVQFNHKGCTNGQLGKITFMAPNQSISSKRCVVVSTLLGAIRSAQNQQCN